MTIPHQSCDGIRVLEFAGAGIPAAYAGWSLARMGAQVTRLAGGQSSHPATTMQSPTALAIEVLSDGKATLPCPVSREELDALLTDVDILICDQPEALQALAGSPDEMRARLPHLVLGFATTFGMKGPYAGFAGTGLDAQALSGVSWAMGDASRAPLSLPPGIVEHQAGAMLAAGCLMGLTASVDSGAGQVVDVALADVLASYVAGNCRLYIHHNLRWHRSGRRASGSGGAYPYVVLPCKDGEVCIFGRTREEWERFVKAMGSPAWASEPRYQELRAMGTQYPEEVDALVTPLLADKTMAELEAIALKNGLIVAPLRSLHEVLDTPQFAERGFLEKRQLHGTSVATPGLPFRVHDARDETAPNVVSTLLCSRPSRNKAIDTRASRVDPARPLAGMRVLDFGWVWSAPWVGTILAELGAQVIKVEHAKRPDNLRLSGLVFRNGQKVEGPSREMSPMFHQINHGKLGITLNAKEPRAAELLKQLAASSDLVVENMSPGSMERVNLGYEALREVNPRIVMLAMSAAGQFGALSGMRAYAPTMSSFVGLETLVGYPDEPPIGALNFGLGDPNASVHGLMATMAALWRARATGQGAYVDLAQLEALLGTMRPYLLQAQLTGWQPSTQGNRHPDMAPHGIYPAAEADAWLTVAVANDVQWQALAKLAGSEPWACDARFQTTTGRLAATTELDTALAAWTSTQPRDGLVSRLRAAGIASSPVLSIPELWADPNFAARHIKRAVHIPVYGPEEVFRAPWLFSDFEPQIEHPGPTTGQHNDYVFSELLGLDASEIASLKESGVIA